MIKFSANIRSACAESDDAITTGSVGIPVQLILSAEFIGLAKTLVFTDGVNSVDLALVGDATEATVPHDVLTTPGRQLRIGIYAADASGNIVIPTVMDYAGQIVQGTVPSGVDPAAPTPSWVAQVQQMASRSVEAAEAAQLAAQDASQDAEATREAAREAVENAEAWAGSAEEAKRAAAQAKEAAGQAQGAAQEAEEQADRAEQAAANAGYMFFYIDTNGDLIYQRTPNVQVNFYLQDGDLFVEAVA